MNDGSFNIISSYRGQDLLIFFRKALFFNQVLEMAIFKYDAFVKSQETPFFVIPAKAGIQ